MASDKTVTKVNGANGFNGLNGLAAGVYVLRLIDGEKVKTQKIVVR